MAVAEIIKITFSLYKSLPLAAADRLQGAHTHPPLFAKRTLTRTSKGRAALAKLLLYIFFVM